MSKLNKILLTISLIVLIVVGFGVFKSRDKKEIPTLKTEKLVSQENDGGNVTVTAKPITLKVGEKPVFDLEFETHSVDLSFDVTQITTLVDDKGNKFSKSNWNGTPSGGHHRSGTLSFNNSLAQTNNVELIIKSIAGVVERKFKWNL